MMLLWSLAGCSDLLGYAVVRDTKTDTTSTDGSDDSSTESASSNVSDSDDVATDSEPLLDAGDAAAEPQDDTDTPTSDTSGTHDAGLIDASDVETDSTTATTDTETATTPTDTSTVETDTRDDTETADAAVPELTEHLLEAEVSEDSAWISRDSNDLGIQGGWNAYADYFSQIHRRTEEITPVRFCVYGKVTYADPSAAELAYGAKVGIDICATRLPGDPNNTVYSLQRCAWSPNLDQKIVGFSFELSGVLPKTELRAQFREHERTDGTYVNISRDGKHQVFFDDATLAYDPKAPPINPQEIIGFELYVPSTAGNSLFDFCIEKLSALTYE